VLKKYKTYIIFGAICFILGGVTLFAIVKGSTNRIVDAMSSEIANGQSINRDLQNKYSQLEKSNSESITTISGLQKRLVESQSTIGSLSARLGNAQSTIGNMQAIIDGFASGLEETGTDIRDVIERLGEIKDGIGALP
jgi:chromosome segregation ATPase